eukprot:6193103-Pleurochrysis_carterae.AAC.1
MLGMRNRHSRKRTLERALQSVAKAHRHTRKSGKRRLTPLYTLQLARRPPPCVLHVKPSDSSRSGSASYLHQIAPVEEKWRCKIIRLNALKPSTRYGFSTGMKAQLTLV